MARPVAVSPCAAAAPANTEATLIATIQPRNRTSVIGVDRSTSPTSGLARESRVVFSLELHAAALSRLLSSLLSQFVHLGHQTGMGCRHAARLQLPIEQAHGHT